MDAVITLKSRLDRRIKSGDRRTQTVGTRVSLSEEQELIAIANRDGLNVSEWVREVLLKEARRSTDDAVFTELVATRMLLVNLIKPLILGEKVSPTWITEAMTMVRKEKHKAAQDVMQQYTQNAGKER
jgi:post-segregation antitoxin (ccd killing protein)